MFDQAATHRRFQAALDDLLLHFRRDSTILAVVLCGSLSHDRVWEKSDIDLAVVAVDDPKVTTHNVALLAGDVNVHAYVIPRATFRKLVEGAERNSFMHSLLARGRLLYTVDPTIADLHATLANIGECDTERQMIRAATGVVYNLYKAQKFYHTRNDLHYTAIWLLQAATPMAQLELLERRLLVDREVLPRALALNPEVFRVVYTDLLEGNDEERVAAALAAVENYLETRFDACFQPLINYLEKAGDVRSASEIEAFFSRNYGIECITPACEYLADRERIMKVGTPVRLTKISQMQFQELAFYSLGAPPREF